MTAIEPAVDAAPVAPPVHDTGLGTSGPSVVLPFRGTQVLLLVLITLVGAVLRLWRLGEWSIWVDEAHTWRDVTMPLPEFFDGARAWYPTSFLMLRGLMEAGWLREFGEGWLRLPFAFCGIVSVPVLALFGNLIVGRRAALMAALFLAINPWHIYWSQNARAYVLVGLFAIVAAGTFWAGVTRRSPALMAGGVVAAIVGTSCHFTGLVLLPVFAAYPLLAGRSFQGRRRWITLFAVGIALTLLPSVLELLPPFQIFQGAKKGSQPSLVHLLQTTAFYFRLPLLCAAAFGLSMLFQLKLQGRALFLACWALLPLLLLGIIGSLMVKVTARYALCALPAVLLLAGAASVRIGEILAGNVASRARVARWWPAACLPAILCLDMGAYDYLYFHAQCGDRGRWREARDYIVRAAGDKLVWVASTNEPSMQYYLRPNNYRSERDRHFAAGAQVLGITDWEVFDKGRDGATYVRDISRSAQADGRVLFFVVALPELQEVDRDGSLRAALRDQCELVNVLPCWVGPKDESIYIWRPRQ